MKAYQFSVQGDLHRVIAESKEDAEAKCCDIYGGFDVIDGKALCDRCAAVCDNCKANCSGMVTLHWGYKCKNKVK